MLSISDKTLIGFIVVFLSSALWPNSPSFALVSIVSCVFVFTVFYRVSAFLSACLLGFLWASASIHYYLTWQIDTQKFNQNVIIVGQVASIVHQPALKQGKAKSQGGDNIDTDKANTTFNLKAHIIGKDKQFFRPVVRVSWYQPSFALSEGHTVRLFVRLKQPIGLANPQGFNYQAWLASQNIAVTAYVKTSPSNKLIQNTSSLRQTYINRLLQSNAEYLPWLLALTFGDRSLLNDQDWALMQNTGTAHLFAISGMHLGIVFGFVFMLTKVLLSGLLQITNRQLAISKILLLSAISVCMFYAYIAGMQVPVMRALIASVLTVTFICLGLYWRPSSIFLILLCLFFILYPFAHLGISFWFSFSAVCFILFFVWRFPITKVKSRSVPNSLKLTIKIWYAFRLQIFLGLVTLPVVLSIFGIVPFSSLLANVLMIPIVSFILVPLCLINAVFIAGSVNAQWLIYLINLIFDWSLAALNYIGIFGSIKLPMFSLSAGQLIWIYVLLFLLCLPASQYRYKRFLLVGATILSLCAFYPQLLFTSKQDKPQWELNAFDVGQGTAIVIRQFPQRLTQQFTQERPRTLIYDTGASFRGGFSMANAVLMPYFEHHDIEDIDYLVLSHFDNDHAGGASFLRKNLNIRSILTPPNGCHVGAPAQWGAIKIEVLWPLSPQKGDENNHSCVLKLSTSDASVILAGDIEKQAERELLTYYKGSTILRADILVAPHHGSDTSSTPDFVAAVSPRYVVFTAGFNNRWGFPAQSVKERYQAINSEMLITGDHGRIQLRISQDKIVSSRYRLDEYKRWYFLALVHKTR